MAVWSERRVPGKLCNDRPMTREPKRRGRRPAAAGDTRGAILEAARGLFLEQGYDATSIRAVALAAGVDPALVHHYFDDKADLFAASIEAPIRPDRIVRLALDGPREKIGETLVTLVLTALENESAQRTIIGLMRTALGHDFAAAMLRQFLVREVFHRIASEISKDRPGEDGDLRANLAATQIVGLVMVRYGVRAEPLASASVAEVADRVGPVIQWHLLGYPTGTLVDPADSSYN